MRTWWRIGPSAKGWHDVYISTSRSLHYCRLAGIQSDWSEFPVSRGLFPDDRTRCSRMQSRKSLGANWNDDARRKRRRWGDQMRSLRFLDSTMARKFFLIFPLSFDAYFFPFFILSRIPQSRNVYIRSSATSSVRFHTAAKRMTTLDAVSPSNKDDGWKGWSREVLRRREIFASLQLLLFNLARF